MTTTAKPDWAAGLIQLLDQQRGIYQQLHELSHRQSQFVADGDAEPLLTLLAQRQQLIDELTRINGRVDPYKRNWPTLWPQLDTASQERIQSLIDEVQRLLDEIVDRDERDRAALAAQRDEVGSGLRRVRAGATVHRAYGQPAAAESHTRYTDRQG